MKGKHKENWIGSFNENIIFPDLVFNYIAWVLNLYFPIKVLSKLLPDPDISHEEFKAGAAFT